MKLRFSKNLLSSSQPEKNPFSPTALVQRSGEGWVRHDDVTLVNPQSQARAVARVVF